MCQSNIGWHPPGFLVETTFLHWWQWIRPLSTVSSIYWWQKCLVCFYVVLLQLTPRFLALKDSSFWLDCVGCILNWNVVLIFSNFKQGGAIVITGKNGHKKSAKVAAVLNVYAPCCDPMCQAPVMFIPFSKPLWQSLQELNSPSFRNEFTGQVCVKVVSRRIQLDYTILWNHLRNKQNHECTYLQKWKRLGLSVA